MKRWLLVLLVLVTTGLALIGVEQGAQTLLEQSPVDEIIAYRVDAAHPVSVEVPAGVERVEVTSWVLVDPRATWEPTARYDYGITVKTTDRRGVDRGERTYEAVSRISGDPNSPNRDGRFAARLAGGGDWVADPRGFRLELRDIAAFGGRITIAARRGGHETVLLRIAYPHERSEVEIDWLQQSFTHQERRELTAGLTALGFDDLSRPAQRGALMTWRRRLSASGKRGVDYEQDRLLLGNFRSPPQLWLEETAGTLAVGPSRGVIVNLRRATSVGVAAPPGTRLWVSEPGAPAPRQLAVGESGQVSLSGLHETAHSLAVRAEAPAMVSLRVASSDQSALLGTPGLKPAGQESLLVLPETRRQVLHRLDPHEPIVFQLADSQRDFGVTIVALEAAAERTSGVVRARWSSRGRHLGEARLQLLLEHSMYDWTDQGAPVSQSERRSLLVPKGADRVELLGGVGLLLSGWTQEPGIVEDLLPLTHQAELDGERVWKKAPYEQRSWAVLSPWNLPELVASGRQSELLAQPRLESRGGGVRQQLPEQSLVPVEPGLEMHMMSVFRMAPGQPAPVGACTPLMPEGTVRVSAAGAAAGTELRVVVASAALGGRIRVMSGSVERMSRTLSATSSRWVLPLEEGEHALRVEGLGDDGLCCVVAAPAVDASVWREQTYFQLAPGRSQTVEFRRSAAQVGWLLLQVAAEGSVVPWVLEAKVDGGNPRKRHGQFFRRTTESPVVLRGSTGEAGRGRLWEAGMARDRVRVLLGDDLEVGMHQLTVSSPAGAPPLWIRAILVGEAAPIAAVATQVRRLEEP
jgi:hypothetical protein